jgi:hypothetical protein
MTPAADDPHARLRRHVYVLLITVGTGAMLGRILAVDAVDRTGIEEYRIRTELNNKEQLFRKRGLKGDQLAAALQAEEQRLRRVLQLRRPFLSANDRSRWCTVRALVEENMRVPGAPYAIDKVIQQPNWDTIDMVKHNRRYEGPATAPLKRDGDRLPGWDGRQIGGHLYSSKPPLLATLMAGEYWVIYRLTGATLATEPYAIGRFMLMTINVLPLMVYFLLLARLVERFGTTDWGRLLVMAAAVFGTFLTTFSVTANNHLPAAVGAAVTLYAAVRIWFDGERRLQYFALAGLFAAFTAANELPATALLVLLGLALLWKAPRPTLLAYAPAVLLIAAAFFGTNWIAHRSLVPAYLHRGQGGPDDWYNYSYIRNGREVESYWNNPVGVDKGEPCWPVYAVNVTVGHHGIFSLTPLWLLSVAGTVMWLCSTRGSVQGVGSLFPSTHCQHGERWAEKDSQPPPDTRRLRELAVLIAVVSLLCLAFYLQPQKGSDYRNYGGVTSGLRWVFWFAPLWLVVMLPAADAMAARAWTRGVALVLLAVSVLSASYPTWNPWTHPWIMDFLYYVGWL